MSRYLNLEKSQLQPFADTGIESGSATPNNTFYAYTDE
jgi:hypothetical protein